MFFFSFSFPLSVIGADAGNGIRVFIPDIGMFVAGLVIWLLCRSLVQKRPPEDMAQYNADFEAEEQVSLFSSLTVFQRCLCHTQGLFAFLTRFNYLLCSSRLILRKLTDYMICETVVSVHSFCTLLTVPKMTDICKKHKEPHKTHTHTQDRFWYNAPCCQSSIRTKNGRNIKKYKLINLILLTNVHTEVCSIAHFTLRCLTALLTLYLSVSSWNRQGAKVFPVNDDVDLKRSLNSLASSALCTSVLIKSTLAFTLAQMASLCFTD